MGRKPKRTNGGSGRGRGTALFNTHHAHTACEKREHEQQQQQTHEGEEEQRQQEEEILSNRSSGSEGGDDAASTCSGGSEYPPTNTAAAAHTNRTISRKSKSKSNSQGGGGGGSSDVEAGTEDGEAGGDGVLAPLTAVQYAVGLKAHGPAAVPALRRCLRDRVSLLRHAERLDHADKGWRGGALLPASDPPLSALGRRQALETGLRLLALQQSRAAEGRAAGRLSAAIVSPFTRCLETALVVCLVGFAGRLPLYVAPDLSDWQQSKVFRAPAVLGGRYTVPGRRQAHGGELRFVPPADALRASLRPFFESLSDDDVRAAAAVAAVSVDGASGIHTSGGGGGEETDKTEAAAEARLWQACAPAGKGGAGAMWAARLEGWLTAHATLPVWASPETHASLCGRIAALKSTHRGGNSGGGGAADAPEAATQQPRARSKKGKSSAAAAGSAGSGGGGASPLSSGGAATAAADDAALMVAQCGAPHPESRTDLARRCLGVLETFWGAAPPPAESGGGGGGACAAADRAAALEAMLPAGVRAACARERRESLPKFFQVRSAGQLKGGGGAGNNSSGGRRTQQQKRHNHHQDPHRSPSSSSSRPAASPPPLSPPPLLPPTHLLCVTHADVIDGLVQAACPRHHTAGAGSVGPCSLTTLERVNDFYYIPDLNERGGGGGAGGGSSSHNYKMNNIRNSNNIINNNARKRPPLVPFSAGGVGAGGGGGGGVNTATTTTTNSSSAVVTATDEDVGGAFGVGNSNSASLSTNWRLVRYGAVDHLRSKVVLQYS